MASKREQVRSDGTISWQVLYRHNGKQTSATFPTMKARNDWHKLTERVGLDAALEALEANEGTDGGTPTLEEYGLEEIELRDISERQKHHYTRWLANDFTPMNKLPINIINQKMIRKWIIDQTRSGASGKTIRNKHGFLSSVFKAAVTDDSLPEVVANPCDGSKLPRVDTGQREEIQALTPGEFALLLDYLPEQWRDFITAAVGTAMRFSELTALPVSAWHPERGPYGELSVFRAWKQVVKGPPVLGPPKTTKSVRPIPVDKVLAQTIERHTIGKKPEDLIFTMPNGDRIDNNNFYQRVWLPAVTLANGQGLQHRRTGKPMVDKHGKSTVGPRHYFYGIHPAKPRTRQHPERAGVLGKWPTIHDLRHTGAAWMVEHTRDLQLVQEFLGHESITTTVDLYANFLPHRRAAMSAGVALALGQVFPIIEDPDTLGITS